MPKGAFTLHFKYAKNIYFCVTFTSSIDQTSLWIHRSPNFDKWQKTNPLHICVHSRSPIFACICIKSNGKQGWVWSHLTTGNDSIWWPSTLHSVESAHVFSVLQYCMSIFPLCKFNSNNHKSHHTLTCHWNYVFKHQVYVQGFVLLIFAEVYDSNPYNLQISCHIILYHKIQSVMFIAKKSPARNISLYSFSHHILFF